MPAEAANSPEFLSHTHRHGARTRTLKRRGSWRMRRRTSPGAPPGTLVADADAPAPIIRVTTYTADQLDEVELESVKDLDRHIREGAITWVDVQGFGDVAVLRELGARFGLQGLNLEDVVDVHQRPKVEHESGYVFLITRMPSSGTEAATEQLSMFFGASFLLTFRERPGDALEPVRRRLRNTPGGRIRSSKPDYLAYALLDVAIDGFFPVLEILGERVEALENDVMAGPDVRYVARIHGAKRDLLALRHALWPQREMVNALVREEIPLIEEMTRRYLRDCYDHVVQLLDVLETDREICSGLVDIYLSSVSARMNEVMKVLTIIATIFIPLSFVASVYGMNFQPSVSPWNMPELSWYLGYPYALTVMLAVACGMLWYFRRKGWIGSARDEAREERSTSREFEARGNDVGAGAP